MSDFTLYKSSVFLNSALGMTPDMVGNKTIFFMDISTEYYSHSIHTTILNEKIQLKIFLFSINKNWVYDKSSAQK